MNSLRVTIMITAAIIFAQLALGGLLTFDFISPTPHIIVGFMVLVMSVILMAVLFGMGGEFRRLRNMSIAMVVVVVAQIMIGFATLDTGYQWLAWVHLIVAFMIYGMIVSASFIATIVLRNSRSAQNT